MTLVGDGGRGKGWGWGGEGGRVLRTKQFMTFSVSVKHKKDKKSFLHIHLIMT